MLAAQIVHLQQLVNQTFIKQCKMKLLKKQSIRQREDIPVKEIKIPELAESITEGTIVEWLVKKGEKVEKGDAVVELETDKVNVEVNSEYACVLTEIISEEGDDVEVGDVIYKIEDKAEHSDVSSKSETEAHQQNKEDSKEEPKQEEEKEEQ